MTKSGTKRENPSQRQKFETLARQLECDEDEEAFKAKVVKIAKAPRAAPKPKD